MEHFEDHSDDRVLVGCAYCGRPEETADHVPSRAFLDQPYPAHSSTVPACTECNRGFSLDEEYLASLLEVVLAGSADPNLVERPKVRRTLAHSPKLAERLRSAQQIVGGRKAFSVEATRVQHVLAKLAVGHAWYELADPRPIREAIVAPFVLPEMQPADRRGFETPGTDNVLALPEIGSRGLQRWASQGGMS